MTENELHIRQSIKKLDQSIDELQKAKSVLISMLPKKKRDLSSCVITLPNGKVLDYKGKEVV